MSFLPKIASHPDIGEIKNESGKNKIHIFELYKQEKA